MLSQRILPSYLWPQVENLVHWELRGRKRVVVASWLRDGERVWECTRDERMGGWRKTVGRWRINICQIWQEEDFALKMIEWMKWKMIIIWLTSHLTDWPLLVHWMAVWLDVYSCLAYRVEVAYFQTCWLTGRIKIVRHLIDCLLLKLRLTTVSCSLSKVHQKFVYAEVQACLIKYTNIL